MVKSAGWKGTLPTPSEQAGRHPQACKPCASQRPPRPAQSTTWPQTAPARQCGPPQSPRAPARPETMKKVLIAAPAPVAEAKVVDESREQQRQRHHVGSARCRAPARSGLMVVRSRRSLAAAAVIVGPAAAGGRGGHVANLGRHRSAGLRRFDNCLRIPPAHVDRLRTSYPPANPAQFQPSAERPVRR